jgi:hypothetical protein
VEWTAAVASFLGAALGVLTSFTTERLRARISGQFWLAQERWKLKADTYSRLLRLLTKQIASIRAVVTILQQGEWESGPLPPDLAQKIAPLISEAILPTAAEVRDTVVVARLWLPSETLTKLDEAAGHMTPPYYPGLFERTADALDRAIVLVVQDAKKDLRLSIEGV